MKKLVFLVLILAFLLIAFPVDAKVNKPKPPKPNSAGHWTWGSNLAFTSVCKAFHQTGAMCSCSLTKVSTVYSVNDFIGKLVNPSLRKRHLVPAAKSIFDTCGGHWDSLFK